MEDETISELLPEKLKLWLGKGSSEGGSVGGQRASRGGGRGLGWEGEQSLEKGVLGVTCSLSQKVPSGFLKHK